MSNERKYECTQERFLDDVKDHQISIEKDNGVNRFVKFRRDEGSSYWFNSITWPGSLCISGDCGTYVFSCEQDMFGFFKADVNDSNKRKDVLLNINPGYWGGKLDAIGTNAGYKEFDSGEFESRVKEYFDAHMAPYIDDDLKNELWEAINDDVIFNSNDGKHRAYEAIHNFIFTNNDGNKFEFIDFFDYVGDAETYTFHYIWCLYAIVWGIMKYDETRNASK